MSFFSSLMDKIRGINQNSRPIQQFVFGSIISGEYSQFKTDPHPTVLCLGCYQKNGKWYIHGLQLHSPYQNYLITTIKNIKTNNIITNPLMFYRYLKLNNPQLTRDCYRTYILGFSNFKTINPGFSNILENNCYPISDQRDVNIVNQLTVKKVFPTVNINKLKDSITNVINSVKVW